MQARSGHWVTGAAVERGLSPPARAVLRAWSWRRPRPGPPPSGGHTPPCRDRAEGPLPVAVGEHVLPRSGVSSSTSTADQLQFLQGRPLPCPGLRGVKQHHMAQGAEELPVLGKSEEAASRSNSPGQRGCRWKRADHQGSIASDRPPPVAPKARAPSTGRRMPLPTGPE